MNQFLSNIFINVYISRLITFNENNIHKKQKYMKIPSIF